MPNDAQNLGNELLAEFEKAFENSPEAPKPPVEPVVVVPPVTPDPVIPPAPVVPPVDNADDNDEEDNEGADAYLNDFVKGLGIEDYQHDATKPINMNTLVEIAKGRIQEIEESYAALNYPVVQQFAQFINDGGDIKDFIEIATYDLQYADVVLDPTDVSQAERLIRDANTSRNVPSYMTEAAIVALKENGQIFKVAGDELKYLQETDQSKYDDIIAAKQEKMETEKNDLITFFTGINDAFKANDFTGFKLPDTEAELVRSLSLPDATGEIGINKMIDELSVSQKALLNYAAYKIAKGETFNVAFSGKGNKNRMEQPITKIFGKGVAGGGGQSNSMTVTEFESALAGLNN